MATSPDPLTLPPERATMSVTEACEELVKVLSANGWPTVATSVAGVLSECRWRAEQMEHNWPRNQHGSLLTKGEWVATQAELEAATHESERLLEWVWWLGKHTKGRTSRNDLYVLTQTILPPDGLLRPRLMPDDLPESWESAMARARTKWQAMLAALASPAPDQKG